MKAMKISNYFELIKPKYMYIKITPDKSIRNYNSSNIAKAIAHTYRTIGRRIRREQKKIFMETDFKIAYIVDVYSSNANFYFMIPKPFVSVIVEKISEIWPRATIEEVEIIKEHSSEVLCYQLTYKKEDALSLQVDKKSNEPLNSILSVIDIMKEDDRVTIIYNFMPKNQFGWLKQYQDTIDKIKNHKPIDREKVTPTYITKLALTTVIALLDSMVEVMNDFLGSPKKQKHISLLEAVATVLEQDKELSAATKKKREQTILDTQISILSESKDKTRQENNAISLCQSYRVLDEDNELTYKRAKKEFNIEDYRFKNIDINTISSDEAQNFIQVPGRNLLRRFNLKHVKTTENPVPKELQNGYISLGNVKCKGQNYESYLEDEYNIGGLPLTLIGSQGSGKSTFIANYLSYANRRGEGGLLIDFIKNCSLSEEVKIAINKENIVELDLSKEECIQGLGFNEIEIKEGMAAFDKLKLANLQAQQTMALVDAISIGDSLSARMRRFLSAAANVVYVQGYSSIRNVIECLENCNKRKEYVNSLSEELKSNLQDEVNYLLELNEYDKKTGDLVGTKENKIEHILDRISLLKEDFKLKYMFNKDCKDNINLVDLMEEGKLVIIKMPEAEFPLPYVKNILVTYWVCKGWLSSQIRGSIHDKPKRTHTVIDEVFQAPTCMKTLNFILPQSRKFGHKFIFSTQYMKQIEDISDSLKASGSSYMILKGTKEDDFKLFESDLQGYEYEDLRDMDQYNSLNLIYYSGGYASFISKLPAPIK